MYILPRQDGNVGIVKEMLNGPEKPDLEEPSCGPVPYSPIFLAFFHDHFQVRGEE